MEKCRFPPGVIVKPDGVNELDPCVYEEVECYKNVTVHRAGRKEKEIHELQERRDLLH